MSLLFLYYGLMKAAGPIIYYETRGVCGYLGAHLSARLSGGNRCSERSGVRKEVEQMFI